MQHCVTNHNITIYIYIYNIYIYIYIWQRYSLSVLHLASTLETACDIRRIDSSLASLANKGREEAKIRGHVTSMPVLGQRIICRVKS